MRIALVDLEPEWLFSTGDPSFYRRVDSLEEANGIFFLCPLCFERNGHNRVGVHGVICWGCDVPQRVAPRPGRWRLQGTGFHDLSLQSCPGKSRSVLLLDGCRWHGFVTDGWVT